jgi:hypothetical protein
MRHISEGKHFISFLLFNGSRLTYLLLLLKFLSRTPCGPLDFPLPPLLLRIGGRLPIALNHNKGILPLLALLGFLVVVVT